MLEYIFDKNVDIRDDFLLLDVLERMNTWIQFKVNMHVRIHSGWLV